MLACARAHTSNKPPQFSVARAASEWEAHTPSTATNRHVLLFRYWFYTHNRTRNLTHRISQHSLLKTDHNFHSAATDLLRVRTLGSFSSLRPLENSSSWRHVTNAPCTGSDSPTGAQAQTQPGIMLGSSRAPPATWRYPHSTSASRSSEEGRGVRNANPPSCARNPCSILRFQSAAGPEDVNAD